MEPEACVRKLFSKSDEMHEPKDITGLKIDDEDGCLDSHQEKTTGLGYRLDGGEGVKDP